ncbi:MULTISPECIES: N-acetylglucosamine kinase [unclassified Roseateles]|uniref:N-acetylglucosamine kinase n=1 Tax=unclassified Roseateles TaxID=2626991 RepID=UPI0006F23F24|nr:MULTISPECIES: BadF/BadG/BcrA/BcrD ATPase family protein [unclassified Roseateles]KQW48245.1 N-acetylglucosamine kinase [Pelomonas sp. Root405]KRA75396.1 N-acetylglucosamine kinase [Pelomonas sp. Root662]
MSSLFLGIDGGGTKTAFVIVDGDGRLLARHESTTSYYLQIGFDALRALLRDGVQTTLKQAGATASDIAHAFAGLPAHGEDSALITSFDALLADVLPRSTVGNDMVCSWAGSLAGADGVSLVAGTGSIAYGEWMGRGARCGGWGEVFGDEGSAHWLAREVLALFSRMADCRAEPGPLLGLVREHFELQHDLDLCAEINGSAARSELAQVARLATAAAHAGDVQARQLLVRAGDELAALAAGVARNLGVSGIQAVPVSYSGGVFAAGELVLGPLQAALARRLPGAVLKTPRFGPELGAALYAARLGGRPLSPEALGRLDG